MAANSDKLFKTLQDGAHWDTGVTFNRGNPVPIDRTSMFKSLADARTYAAGGKVGQYDGSTGTTQIVDGAVAFVGQVLAVVAGNEEYSQWSFSDSGTHTVTFATTWKIDGADTGNKNVNALSITAGSVTATRTITKPYDVTNWKIVDTSGTLVQIDAAIEPGDLPIATTTTLGAIKVGEGLGIAADGTLSAQKLTVDQKVEGNQTSENPASTKAVYDWSLSTLNTAATTAQGKVDTLESALKNNYLPSNYLSVGVANSPSSSDKLMKSSEVDAKIQALDVAIKTFSTAETLSSIEEVDGKIIVTKHSIQIDKSQVNDLTSDLTTINTKIGGLQTISANHETRLTTVEGKVTGLIDMSAALDTKIGTETTNRIKAVGDLSTSLSTTVDAKIKNITDNYALSADVTAISGSLYSKIETDAAAAKAAGELSAQAVRNTYELCAVKYDDVKGGKAAITTSNKLVTQEDIAALTGVMHFVGTTEDTNLSDGYQGKPTGIKKYQAKPEGEGKNPEQGDFVVRTDNAKEFVYVGTWSTGKWNEIGDEDLYAKKSELDAVESKVDTHIADTDVHVSTTDKESWNAKATSADVSAIANAYRGYEETRATGVESKLRTDVNAISGQVSSFSNTWKSSVDLSVSNLSAYAKGLSTDLASEIARAKAAEQALENGLSDYALSADVTAIKNALTAVDAGLRTDVNTVSTDLGTLSTSFNSYKTTNDAAVSAVDTKANGIRTDLNTVSSDLDKLESIAINSVILNGLTATVSKNVATLSIDVINCGGAE